MTKKILWFLLVTCSLFIHQRSVWAQDVHQIIEAHLQAMGGKQNLSTLKSLKVSSVVSVMGVEMQLQTSIVHKQSLRSETNIQGMTIVQVVDKGSGWQINPLVGLNKPIDLSKAELQALEDQLDLAGLLNYQEKGYQATLIGEDNVLDTPVFKIQLRTPSGVLTTNYISKETHLVVQSVIQMSVEGQVAETTITPSNYKKVDGIMFPFTSKIRSSKMPSEIMVSQTKRVEVNPVLPSNLFKRP